MTNAQVKISAEQSEFLSRMARATLNDAFLASIHGCDVYQVTQGWQREVLLGEKNIVIARNTGEMRDAVQASDVYTIFIPKESNLTQEIAERILEDSRFAKTIFWEI